MDTSPSILIKHIRKIDFKEKLKEYGVERLVLSHSPSSKKSGISMMLNVNKEAESKKPDWKNELERIVRKTVKASGASLNEKQYIIIDTKKSVVAQITNTLPSLTGEHILSHDLECALHHLCDSGQSGIRQIDITMGYPAENGERSRLCLIDTYQPQEKLPSIEANKHLDVFFDCMSHVYLETKDLVHLRFDLARGIYYPAYSWVATGQLAQDDDEDSPLKGVSKIMTLYGIEGITVILESEKGEATVQVLCQDKELNEIAKVVVHKAFWFLMEENIELLKKVKGKNHRVTCEFSSTPSFYFLGIASLEEEESIQRYGLLSLDHWATL